MIYTYAGAQVLRQRAYNGQNDPNFSPADPNFYQDRFYVHNRLGSVRLVVDYNDLDGYVSVANSYTYTPFGSHYDGEAPAETVENPFKFTGQWHDAEINQYYLRARMYDPAMMRFTTRDPARGKFTEPMTLHKYLYCWNNPANLVDLTGNSPMNDVQFSTVLSTSIDGLVFGALGGLMEGIFKQTLDWMGGEEFSWADVGWSTVGGAAAGLTTGFAQGVFIGKAALRMKWSSCLADVAFGFAGGAANDIVQRQRGANRMKAGNIVHVMAVNALAASVDAGWW